MILKYTINLMIISMVYSVNIDPVHISNYLMRAPNKPSPTNYISHLGDVCTLFQFSYMKSVIFINTNEVIRNSIINYSYAFKSFIAQLFKYMTSNKYDKVGRFMYDVYANIQTYEDYLKKYQLSEEIEKKLLELDIKLYHNLHKIITSNYWRENSEEIISSIPNNQYLRLLLNNDIDFKSNYEDMNVLTRVCFHLLKSYESEKCFENILTNLINMQLTPIYIKFIIMNYRTTIKCDNVDLTKIENIASLESLKTDTIYLMKKQMQNVLIVYSELLLIMYNMEYFPSFVNPYDLKNYLNALLEEFININEFTRGFSLYLHIMNGQEIAVFMDKYIKFQLIFRTHFKKFLTGVEDVHIDENLYLQFLLIDSHKYDEHINYNNTISLLSRYTYIELDFSNNNIYKNDLRDIFRNFAILNNGEYYQEFKWESLDFHSLKLSHLLYKPGSSTGYIEDSFSFEQRMNIVIFLRLVSQDLQHTLAGLMDITSGPVLQTTIRNTYYEVFIAAAPTTNSASGM